MRLVALVLVLAGAAAHATDPVLTATLDPTEIRFGQDADLSVTFPARRADSVKLPDVDGLDFENTGQSSSVRIVNGVASASTTCHVRVTARRTGSFTIPPIEASVGGRVLRSEPLELQVVARAPRPTGTAAAHDDAAAGEAAFITVTPAKRELYVGERVPVEIRACFRAGQRAAIRSLPRLEGSAFTLEVPDKEPVRTDLDVGGEPYVALSWEGALSAVKEGDHAFEASLEATLVRPRARSRDRRADDFFESALDSFFDQGREEEVTLRAEPQTLVVKALPEEGRPGGFGGAVGRFRLSATAKPLEIAAGEPITLTTTVEGEGNFARVSAPAFEATPDWKSYPATASFEPRDSSGAEGRKAFEQAIVPRGHEVKGIPPVAFSYFDPERGEYVTLRTDPIEVKVSGAPAASEPEPPAPEAPSNLRTWGAGTRSLRPVWLSGWFHWGGLALVVALAVAVLALRWLERGPRPASLRTLRKETDRAIAQGDAWMLFAVLRAAVQDRLAPRWNIAPRAITLVELRARGASGAVQEFFAVADAVAFSGLMVSRGEMLEWQERLIEVIARMEKE